MILGIVLLFLLVVGSLGLGILSIRGLGRIGVLTRAQPPSIGETGLMGLLTLALIALTVHFAIPLGGPVPWIVIGAGVAAAVVYCRSLYKAFSPSPVAGLALLLALIVIFAIYIPDRPLTYDSGFYHLQAMMWMRDEPVIFGLAQIHGRFGFNSVWLGVGALAWLPGFGVRGIFLAEALPVLFVLHALMQHVLAAERWRALPLSTSFAALTLIFLLLRGNYFLITGITSTDNVTAMLVVMSVYLFLRTVDRGCFGNAEEISDFRLDAVILALLSVMTILVKLALVPVLLLPIGIVAASWIGRLPKLPVFRLGLVVGVIGMLWSLRAFVLTGCLVYPSAPTCFHTLPWAVRALDVQLESTHIHMFPRFLSNEPLLHRMYGDNWAWVPTWFDIIWNTRVPRLSKMPKAIAIVTAIAVLVRALELVVRPPPRSRTSSGDRRLAWAALFWLGLTILVCIAFWFLLGPQPRYIVGPFVALAVLPGTMILWPGVADFNIGRGGRAVILPFYALVFAFFVTTLDLRWRSWAPDPAELRPSVDRHTTIDGVTIFEPRSGQQCYMAPKPCAPDVNPYLVFDRLGPYLMIRNEAPDGFAVPRT
ncbi:MAG: hypothetical protein GY791_06740 [Alphaproteobacteria bacterium]|nr:hypothetical protein [Alphaproteobacteria bacterium]